MPDLYASPQLQASIRAGQAPLWSDYLKTVGIGTTDVLAAVPAGTRYAAELTDTDLGESIASSSQYLQDVIHGWGEDLEAGLSEPAKERLLAEFGSEAFWKHPASSIALKATRTAPSMAATVGATMFTGGGAPAAAMLAGVSGGLSATQTVDEMYRAVDTMSDADLRVNSKLYNQFRQDGLSERDARKQLNRINIGAKPAVLFAVAGATSIFGPEAQILRGLGQKGLGSAYSGGILKRTGKSMGAGAVSEAIETGAETLASEQGAVDVGFQSAINPYRVAAATAEGATLGALFGSVGGLKGPTRPAVRPTTNANPRPEADNPPAAAIKPIVTPAPGPVSMPGKGSNTQATPPIVAGREGHTAATSRVATVPGAKGDAFKKSKGVKTNVIPLVQPAPATGTAATQTPTPAQVAPQGPQGDPGGLVAGQTEVAALAAQSAPTRPLEAPTVTPAPVAPAPAPVAATAPAPITSPTAPTPTSPQGVPAPGAGFGAGTVAAPTQAVPTGPARVSTLAPGTVEQPVGPVPTSVAPTPVTEAVPTAPRILPTVAPEAPVTVAPAIPAKVKVPRGQGPGEKDTKRAAKRTQDAQIAQDFLNARPAEPVIPSTPEDIEALATELTGIVEGAKSLDVKFRGKVGYEKTPASLVWLREVETLLGQLKNKKIKPDELLGHITKFFDREARIRTGDPTQVASVKQERSEEAAAVKQARTGRAGELAATAPSAATEEQAAVTEQAQEAGTAEVATGTEEAETKTSTVRGVEAPVETREITLKGGKKTKVEVSKAAEEEVKPEASAEDLRTKSQKIIAEAKAKAEAAARARGEKARAEIEARTAAQNVAAIKAKAAEKAKPKPLPPDLAEKVEAAKAKTEAKKEAQEAKLPPKVRERKALTVKATPEAIAKAKAKAEAAKAPPKPSGKAALGAELAKIEPEPSTAQLEADNASKGHIPLEGMQVAISTAAKTERHGVTPAGSRWSYLYNFSYGHILGTKAPDGKPIDIFLGPEAYPKNSKLEGLPVVIIEQVDPDTKAPDEPKVMYGFRQVKDAVEAYDESYPRGPERRGDVVVMTPREFAQWRKSKEERASEEPTGEPVSEADVAVEEAATEDISAGVSKVEIETYFPKFAKHFRSKPTMEGRIAANRAKGAQDLKTIQDNTIAQDSLSSYMGKGLRAILNYFLSGEVGKKWHAIYPQFAKRVRVIAGDVQVHVIPDDIFNRISNPAFGAAYDPINDLIIVKESVSKNTFYMARVVLHEGTHAAFWKTTHQHPELQQVLGNILFEAREAGLALTDPAQRAEFARHYGVSNIDELIAEAFSNERFQEFLASQPASARLVAQLGLDKGPHSMWDVLVRLVGKILGLPNAHDSLLGAVLRVTERMESRAPDLTGPASDTAIKWRLGLQDLGHYSWTAPTEESLLAPLRLPDAFNKRLPSQVRQAPQQVQQGSPWLMFLRTMDQLVQAAKGFGTNFYEHLRKAADTIEKIRVSADRYLNESMPIIRELHALERKYKGTGQWQAFTDLVMDETSVGVFADRPLPQKHLGKNTLRGIYPKARHADLHARWQALPDDLKDARLKAMNFFTQQQNLEKIGIIRNTLKVAGFPDPDLAQRLFDGDETDADIALLGRTYDHIKDASELAKIKGPYFPQMRRGEHVVRALYKITAPTNVLRQIDDNTWEFAGKNARKQAAAFAAAQDHMKPTVSSVWVDTNTGERYFNLGQPDEVRVKPQDADAEQRFRVSVQNRFVEFFESKREALEVEYQLRRDFAVESVQDTVPRRFQPGDRQTDMLSHQMQTLADSLERRPGFQNLSPNQQNQVVQTLNVASLRLLSQTRIQTKRLPRTNVLGASRDLTRNTLEYAQSVSGYLARLDHQDALNSAMRDARAEADSANDYGKGYGQGAIMNEMERRVARSVAFEERGRINDWINRSLAVSFADKLISPAYNILNSLQVIMTTYPTLAARFGPGRAAVMLLRVYRDIGAWQTIKSGLVASKRALREGPSAQFPSIVDDIKSNLKSTQELNMLDYIIERGGIDPDAGIEVSNMIETRTGAVGTLDQGINYLQTFGRQMPRSIEAINRTVTAIAAYRLEMARSGDNDVAMRFAQETVNMTQGLYSHSNAAPVFNHPLGKMSFQFKKFGQLIYGMIGHNVGKAIRNAEPGDRAEAVKTLAYMAATHVVMAGALGLPTEPFKWLIIGARQAGITELSWADVENYEREILASAFGQQLGEIAARGISRALPEGFAFDMSSRVGLQDLFTFGEPRSADKQDLGAFMWDTVGGAPAGLVGDWMRGSQALMNGEWVEAAERFTPIKMVADAIKSYRTTSEGKKTAAGYESLSPYSLGEAAIRTFGLTPAREAETTEARNYFYSATKRASAERNSLMQDWYQAAPNERARMWGQVEAFNRGKTSDEKLTRSELDKYTKRRRTEERSGLVKSGFRVTRREQNQYKKLQGTYNISP